MEAPVAGLPLVKKDGSAGDVSGKVVALYFSAHWCPPCRGFTPALKQFYDVVKEKGENLEIIFVSADKSPAEFQEYFQNHHGDWLAVDFKAKKERDELSQHFKVEGIPSLIVLDHKGKAGDDWVRRVALSGDEVFVGTASSGIRRHVLGAVEARQVFRVQGSPSRMVPADHQAQADPETSVISLAWNGRFLFAGLAGGRLQVWNDDGYLIFSRSVDTRPCYVCVHDNVLVAAAGDSVMCWDVNNLEDVPLCKIQASCRVHCLAPAFEDSIILGLADGSVELRQLRRLSLSARRAAAHGVAPVSAACVDGAKGRLVTGDDAGRVKCWEMNEKMPGEDWTLRWNQEHKGRIVAINRGGGESVLTAALDGRIIVWDAETGEFVFGIPNHKVWLGSMCLSEDKDLLVTDGRDNAVYLYNFAEE
eukprot:s559_g11.t1